MTDKQTDAAIAEGLRELQRQGDPLVAQHAALPWGLTYLTPSPDK
jgi:hypothetical protein